MEVELSRGQHTWLPPSLEKLISSLGHVARARKARVSAMVVLFGVPLFEEESRWSLSIGVPSPSLDMVAGPSHWAWTCGRQQPVLLR